MRIGIFGRTEILFDTCLLLKERGHEIAFILTSKAAPEYTKNVDDFKELANKLRVPFFYTSTIDKRLLQHVKSLLPIDISVSINYTSIVSQEFIDLFNYGILNAHSRRSAAFSR